MIGEAWSNDSLRISGIEVTYLLHPFTSLKMRLNLFLFGV